MHTIALHHALSMWPCMAGCCFEECNLVFLIKKLGATAFAYRSFAATPTSRVAIEVLQVQSYHGNSMVTAAILEGNSP